MKRQITTLTAILKNWDVVQGSIKDANNATDAALEGNALVMDSIEGRITQFNSAIQQLSSATINSDFVKFIISAGTGIVNLTTSMGGLVPVLGTVIGLFAAFKAEKLASGITTLVTAFKSMFGVVTAGTSKMASGIAMFSGWAAAITAAIAVISGISSAVDNAKQKIQEQATTAQNEWQEEKDKAESLNTELENTEKIIEELESKDSLTVIEQDQLERTREENAELQKQADILKEITKIKEKEARNDTVAAINDKKEETRTKFFLGNGYLPTEAVNNMVVTGDLFNDKELYDNNSKYFKQTSEGPIYTYEGYVEANKRALPELKAQLDEARRLQSDNLEEIQAEYDAALLAVKEYYEYLDGRIGNLSRVTGTNLSKNELEFNAMIDERDAIGDLILEITDASKRSQFDNAVDKFKEEASAVRDVIKDAENTGIELTIDDIKVNAPNLVDQLRASDWTDEEIVETVKIELAPDSDVNLDTDYFSELSSSLFSNTEAYKALTAAMDEQASAGVLSIETYQTLLEQIPELNDLLTMTSEGYALNTEAVYDYIEAQDEIARGNILDTIQSLKDKLADESLAPSDALKYQNDISQLEALYAAVDRTTGAYKRFAEAKKTANQDELHNEAVDAVSAVEEGLKSGKIGTDDYKSGLSFILGKDFADATTEQLVEAGEEVLAFKKKYFSDDDKKNVTNFADLLVDKGLASWDGDMLNLSDTINVDEFAEDIGMGKDAVISLFQLMEAFGAKLNWTELLDLDNLTDAEIKAMDKAQANNILPQVKENAEQANAAVADLQKQADKGVEFTADNTPIEEAISEAEKKAEQASQTLEVVQEHAEGISEVDYSSMSLPELLEELTKLKGAIDDINANGLKPSVEMQGQYDELVSLVDEKLKEEHELNVTANTDKANEAEQSFIENGAEKSIPFNTAQGEDNTTDWLDKLTEPREVFVTTTVITTDETDKLKIDKKKINAAISAGLLTPDDVYMPDGSGKINMNKINAFIAAGRLNPETISVHVKSEETSGQEIAEQVQEQLDNSEPIVIDKEIQVVEPGKETLTELSETSQMEINVEVNADTENVTSDIEESLEDVDSELPIVIDVPREDIESELPQVVDVPLEFNADTSNISSEVQDVVPNDVSTTIEADTTSADSKVNALQTDAEKTATKPIDANTSSALSKLSALAQAASKTITQYVQIKYLGQSNAKGTKNADNGLSLVDEKGAELIEHTKSGTFELGTDNGARFTTLQKGDVVHTAKETKTILSRMAKIGGFFRDGLNRTKSIIGNAFATGVSGSMSWSLINSITGAITKSGSTSGSTKVSSTAKKASSSWKSYTKKLFDWVEIRLERLQTVTNAWLLEAQNAIGYLAKNAQLEGALSAVQDQIEATTQAYSKYMAQADAIAKKTALSASTIEKIKNGTIEIASYSDSTQEKIKAYQEW